MTPVIAIARLIVSSAMHSKVLVSLSVSLLLSLLALPLALKGDGTAVGHIRLIILYPLSIAFFLLGIASLWMACGTISKEIADKSIHLVSTKPVHYLQIWLGKWLGILLINTVLLILTGIVSYTVLHHVLRTAQISETEFRSVNREILCGRRLISPQKTEFDPQTLAYLQNIKNQQPRNSSRKMSLEKVKQDLLIRQATVPPGQSIDWRFDISESTDIFADSKSELTMRFSLTCAAIERTPITGTWAFSTDSRPDLYQTNVENILDGIHQLPLPSDLLSHIKKDKTNICLTVSFFNKKADTSKSTSPTPQPTVFFDPHNGLEFLIKEASFETNLIRTFLIILAYLACITALGITAGSVFSFPVATFASICTVLALLVTLNSAPFADNQLDHHGVPIEKTLYQRIGDKLLYSLRSATSPIIDLRPLGLLSDGIIITERNLLKALLILGIGLPGILAAAGAGAMSRRELAL